MGEREEKIEKLNATAPANESVNSTVSFARGFCEGENRGLLKLPDRQINQTPLLFSSFFLFFFFILAFRG